MLKSKYIYIFLFYSFYIFIKYLFLKILFIYLLTYLFLLFSSFGIQFILQIRNPFKKQDISIGTIIKYHFFGLSSQGIPRHPIIDQIIIESNNSSSTSTITTLQDIILYRIEFSGTHHPQCRYCKNIPSKEEIIIRTSGIFFPPSISYSAGFANWIFCLNYSCIKSLIESKGEMKDGYSGFKYLFPIFNKKLFLSSTIEKQLTIEQSNQIEQLSSNELNLQIIK